MNTNCMACFELIKKNKEHPSLKTVSDLGSSKICKCGECGALLMSTANTWEQVIKGSSQHKNSKRKVA